MEKQCFGTVFYMLRNEPFLPHTIIYPIIYQEQIGSEKVENIHLFKKINRKIIGKRFPEKCSSNQFLWSARKISWCGIQASRLFGKNKLCIPSGTARHWSGSTTEISFDLRDIFSRSRWSCRIYFQRKKGRKRYYLSMWIWWRQKFRMCGGYPWIFL